MVGGSQEADRHLQSVQDTMRLDRPRDKRETGTHVSGTRVLSVAYLP